MLSAYALNVSELVQVHLTEIENLVILLDSPVERQTVTDL